MKKILIFLSIILLLLAGLLFSYSRWNSASPDKTCASCHEISNSVDLWSASTHRNIACKECHGTALSEGIHSLKEKGAMLYHHSSKINSEDIKITEDQRLKVMERCAGCHQAEYAKWNSGGHAMNYSEVFLDSTHNKTETISEDCLRCHGMFFDKGTVNELVGPLATSGPWKLKIAGFADRPAIPCFACHEVHTGGVPGTRQKLQAPSSFHYARNEQTSESFFSRKNNMYFPVSQIIPQGINYNSSPVKMSGDPKQTLCLQCHSPNAFNTGGTNDDRTPRGVHEGISCLACHDPHSNSAVSSCKNCHPAISNCRLDVEKMNTTFKDSKSRNNIHFVGCADCHTNGKPVK